MRTVLLTTSIVLTTIGSGLSAQIRTPIATEPLTTTQPGPAPYNAKAIATSPTSVTVSWDAVSGARAYTVDRTRTDDPACCVAHSGLITTPSWTDGALTAGMEYSFVITAFYFDGRVGATEVVVATPMPVLPVVRVPRGGELSSAEGVLRLTPCGQKNGGGPGPVKFTPYVGSPAGARFAWPPVSTGETNYVVDRAPEGTTAWTLVGSTCGGPSPIYVSATEVRIRDLAGGVVPNSRYVYRVTAIQPNGAAGWNTYHFFVPCTYLSIKTPTVTGSTVSIGWTSGSSCSPGAETSATPDNYTLTSSYGFAKTSPSPSWSSEVIYGVPVGTHTFTVVGNYRTGGSTRPASIKVTVAY